MISSYKRLGDYIQEVNIRNKDLKQYPLLGVSIKKEMMTSIANTVGTDMSTYKIIQKNQFAYGPVTSRNGDKISIALSCEEKALLSQAYVVFETNNELLPEYLMMWFRRPEFDRYARYKSHGSAREIFDWQEMSEVMLPIPSVEKQQEMVNEYHTIQNRINLNNQLIAKLEETAQTIYKQWFVDFEFPTESHCEKRGTSDEANSVVGYRSSGGKMVWCEELEKEIPEGWEVVFLDEICNKLYGYPFDSNLFTNEKINNIPLIRIRDILNGFSDVYTSEKVDAKFLLENGDLLIGMDGTFHISIWFNNNAYLNQRVVRFRSLSKNLSNLQVLYSIYEQIKDFENNIHGTTVAHLSDKHLKEVKFIIGNDKIQSEVTHIFEIITMNIINTKQENQKLEELKELLLGRMVRN